MSTGSGPLCSRAPDGFSRDIDEYLAHLGLERGLSNHTVSGYQYDLDQCARFLNRSGVADWLAVDSDSVVNWIRSIDAEDYTAASLARKLAALRGLARYLVSEGRRTDDFSALLSGPKLLRRLPGCLSMEEVDSLMRAPSLGDPYGIRDRAMLELMYSSGLRVSELIGLQLQQVDLIEGLVRVYGKGAKERLVPLGTKAIEALKLWLADGRPRFVKSRTRAHLFLSERGGGLSRISFWVIVRKYARSAGITKPVKPHLLRHSFATHMLSGGADLRSIQEMMGHAKLSTTQIYTSVDQSRLVALHSQFHPRSKLDLDS